jgi:cephalosporin hydroxylase/GT2 family glycosyltransferase
MYPLWDDAIAPVIEAVGAHRIIEIGALRGETTARMLERLGSRCELHVIDPEPQFDPSEHERAFPGRYHFYRGTSHEVLPSLPPADVVLVDGDHNWYTVYHELRILAGTARTAGVALPVLVLHDVAWPYGRRDLYYAPERIPAEFRQPYRRAGMRPGRSELITWGGGMNRDMANATHEGGPRNGVMTGLEDFLSEHPEPVRVVVLPIFYGMAIVAEQRLVRDRPELAALLDHLESPDGQRAVLDLGERIRIDEAIMTQSWLRNLGERVQRGAERYLALVKALLLDERNLRHEMRVAYLLGLRGAPPDAAVLRDPARGLPHRYKRLLTDRFAGRSPADGLGNLALTTMGRAQLDRLEKAAGRVLAAGVAGDFAEVAVAGGGGGILLRATLEAHEIRDRRVWLADAFSATAPAGDASGEPGDPDPPAAVQRLSTDLNAVRDAFAQFGLLDDRVRFLHGPPVRTVTGAPMGRLALLRLGEGLGPDAAVVLERLHSRLSPGAEVIVSGTGDAAVEEAVTRVRDQLRITTQLERIDWNSVAWRHEAAGGALAVTGGGALVPEVGRPVAAGYPPLTPAAPSPSVALSVVVVFFNMRREAARTLQSLTRSYQRRIEDLDYEVLVVDNGSDADQRLVPEFVASFGPQFRLLELDGDAHPSPTVALNAGIAASRGEALALMIDGAHVLTPGVLNLGMKALQTYAPAVVATQQWYVGPGQQGDAQQVGYDQQVEDRLFASIDWPVDGYRLFEIGHFIGERDWLDGIVESNCLFAPRKLLEQVGGFDDSFSMPGGGYANLDLFERLAQAPGVTPASILGEGTFHQFHGGTTTNVADETARRERVVSYRQHFEALRGRPLVSGDRPVHYVGAMATWPARRTRARRWPTLVADAMREPTEQAGPLCPIPDELKFAAIESVWDHQAWKDATWLGRPVNRYPADLHVYQELLVNVRPSLLVLVGDDDGLGGRALFVASVCDQLGHGRVVAVGRGEASERPTHPRVTHVAGAPESMAVAQEVAGLAPEPPDALVIVGLGAMGRVVAAFEHYAPLVPVGGYVVVENTVVNGRPAGAGFGPGPYEAVEAILGRTGEFVPDPAGERYMLTFNRSGYLKRVRM